MSPTPKTTRADAGHVKAFNFIGELARHEPSMPLGAILVLLCLYENRDHTEGTTLKKLRADLGVNSTVAIRSLYYWSDETIAVQIDLNPLAVVLRSKSSLNPRRDLTDDLLDCPPESHQFLSRGAAMKIDAGLMLATGLSKRY